MKIKQYIRLLPAVALFLVTSCADDAPLGFSVDKPESIAQYEYLNAYDVLKSYVRSDANPNFKLGTGVTVSDYNKNGYVYNLINSNYAELTAGNAMKYGSCVGDDGTMNFSTVEKFVQMAQTAGVNIYGHTLCWHSQQNNTYLNGLIAPTEVNGEDTWKELITGGDAEGDASSFFSTTASIKGNPLMYTADGEGAGGSGRALKVINENVGANDYDNQFFISFPTCAEGETYELSLDIRADQNASIGTQAHVKPQQYKHWEFFGTVSATTEWKAFKKELTITADQAGAGAIAFNIGATATTYYVDNISLKKLEKGGVTVLEPSVITNTDFETDASGWGGWGNGSSRGQSANGEGYEGGHAFKFTNPSAVNSWEAQIAYDFSEALLEGSTYVLNFQVRATAEGTISAGLQDPSSYSGRGDFGSFKLTTEWKEYTLSTTVSGENAKRFLFNYGNYAGTIYVDKITLRRENPDSNSIEKTPEEKKEILTVALETWIAGMLEACDGYVKSWDVVNEALSGTDSNGDGWYDLQSVNNVSAEDAEKNFYWQDYLGDDFVRTVVELARKHGPENMILFVNDYNLESDWDGNKKLKSLVHWIERWEQDETTKIDGIGTQMHVSCYMNAATQKSKEDHVVKMFELLAASGKLIKITELDMGMIDESGNNIMTKDVTFEQQKAMSNYYQFIVEKYFEIIPVAQQYGIAHWSPTDSPEGSGWRAGQPIGLWDLNYNRKPAYGGFANGLAGKDVSADF